VITAAAADSSSLMLYTLVGVALGVLVLLFVLLLFCRGRKRLLRGADDAPPRSGLVALDPWVRVRRRQRKPRAVLYWVWFTHIISGLIK
jgi:hypothetical protein